MSLMLLFRFKFIASRYLITFIKTLAALYVTPIMQPEAGCITFSLKCASKERRSWKISRMFTVKLTSELSQGAAINFTPLRGIALYSNAREIDAVSVDGGQYLILRPSRLGYPAARRYNGHTRRRKF